ncbi:MAG: Fe-S-cluster-containing hydrogenase [Caldilineaceae bacterium]
MSNATFDRPDTADAQDQRQNLSNLSSEEEFEALLTREQPRHAAVWKRSQLDRRSFMKVMGATLALTGLAGCTPRPPDQPIVPYVRTPEFVIPGNPIFFATTMPMGGYGMGAVIETHEGRPTRIEGNPFHPASLGSSDRFLLASILDLYHPDRLTDVRNADGLQSWDAFNSALQTALADAPNGQGLYLLTEAVSSPTMKAQIDALLAAYPDAQWHQYEPVNEDSAFLGAQLAFDEPVNTVYHFDQADVVLALDGDFLTSMPGSVRYARDFMDGRRVRMAADGAAPAMNRLYAVESTPTSTGAVADNRLILRASEVELLARAVAQALGVDGGAAVDGPWDPNWVSAVAEDLQAHAGSSIIIPGREQSPVVHALAHAMNAALGNVGSTVTLIPPVLANPVAMVEDLQALTDAMTAGDVKVLLVLGGNPAYSAPADIDFAGALGQVPFSAHLSQMQDETSMLCMWSLPQTHFIEEWGDILAYDGSASLVQPPIGPLYPDAKSALELIAGLAGDDRTSYDLVRATWESAANGDFESFWRRSLHNGVIEGSAPEALSVQPAGNALPEAAPMDNGLEVIFRPDATIWDGRFAANGWLQELPKPLTQLTWDNMAAIAPAMATAMGLSRGDVVELSVDGRTVKAPIYVQQGHPNNAVTVTLGYGRTAGAGAGTDAGFNAYAIRPSGAQWNMGGAAMQATGETYVLATTQDFPYMEGAHDAVEVATLSEFIADPEFVHKPEKVVNIIPEKEYNSYKWGMSIDLTACIGCNACTIACQSENNISTVGKHEVEINREMHWIRVDRYYEGPEDDPATYFQPVPCMQCEKAPCEMVCPVQATVHSSEGLNQMVYNRCVGTRYCSANCPYGVRRFNFLDFVDPALVLVDMRNPDVTVRARGVMEKCTYCVQRISEARIRANREGRMIEDGEVTPACAAACPTQAIVFGDLNDAESRVVKLKQEPQDYAMLADENTVPRTTYLARIYNPNEQLTSSES